MKMKRNYRPELIVSKDACRFNICEPHLDVLESRIVATNGHMMIALPVTPDAGDTPGQVPVEALKAARTQAGRGATESVLKLNGTAESLDGKTFPRLPVHFPPWQSVLPKHSAETFSVGLNAYYLHDLAQAMGSRGTSGAEVVLTFDLRDAEAPIDVRCSSDEAPVAVLMPTRHGKGLAPALGNRIKKLENDLKSAQAEVKRLRETLVDQKGTKR